MKNETKTTPTYKKGRVVRLRFVECPATPGIYVLQRADGSPHGATWRPHGHYSMLLPKAMTVYAVIDDKHGKDFTVCTPAQLGRRSIKLSGLKDQSRDLLAEGGQHWARPAQLAVRFGCKHSQMSVWLAALRAAGRVRMWQPELPGAAKSHTYYNIADIERAWQLKQDTPPTPEPKLQQRAQQYPFRRQLPPEQQRGLAAMEALKARIAAENSTPTC